jgi:uncharacterized membrane protein YphA (DoxX/SURF4 family)
MSAAPTGRAPSLLGRLRSAPGPVASPGHAIAMVRIGLGVVWTLNLLFILDPANQFFSGFSATAQSFGGTTIGGPSLSNFVASNSEFFSLLIAGTTLYLAVALIVGMTTRVACLVGLVFNAALLVTQFGTIVVIPGGTDVGPMPLYIVIYLGLLANGGPTLLSVDALWAARRASRSFPAHVSTPSRHVASDPYSLGGLGP